MTAVARTPSIIPQQKPRSYPVAKPAARTPSPVRLAPVAPKPNPAPNPPPPPKPKRSIYRICLPCLVVVSVLALTLGLAVQADGGKESPAVASAGKIDDKALKEAELAQKAVQEREEKLIAVLKEIEEAVKDIEPGNFTKERRALDGFKKVIPLLKERSAWLIDHQQEFAKHMDLYKAALQKTPAAFRRASEVYARFAAQEGDLFFKEQYLDMANRSKKLATAMEARAKAVEGAQSEVAQKLKFVERSVVFLNRLEEFLAIYDPAGGKNAEVDQYIRGLDAYISQFHKSINAFRQLSDRIQNGTPTQFPERPAGKS